MLSFTFYIYLCVYVFILLVLFLWRPLIYPPYIQCPETKYLHALTDPGVQAEPLHRPLHLRVLGSGRCKVFSSFRQRGVTVGERDSDTSFLSLLEPGGASGVTKSKEYGSAVRPRADLCPSVLL